MAASEWIIRRNCSITPRQVGRAYAAICLASFSVAAFFAVRGAWYILVFSALEMAAVGAAFLHFGRHATDREHIMLADGRLTVRLTRMEKTRCFELEQRFIRVGVPTLRNQLVGLEDRLVKVEVGRYLSDRERRELAAELRQTLSFGDRQP